MSSLLPNNASKLERDIEALLPNNLTPEIVKQLFDPWACPLAFLPWLAFFESVDAWNDAWPETTKRSVIANAQTVHRHKGLAGGLTDSLAALGVELDIKEWWQQDPIGERGTMQLTLWITENSPAIDNAFVGDILRTIEQNKRLSIHYTFKLGVDFFPAQFALGLSAQFHSAINIQASAKAQAQSRFSLGLGLSAQFFCWQKLDLVV